MNILFVSESIWTKGVVFDLHVMAESLAERGHKVYAVDTGDGSGKILQRVARVYPKGEVHLFSPQFKRIPMLSTVSAMLSRYKLIAWVLVHHKIDVIVLYSAFNSGWQTIDLAEQCHIPVVFRNIDMFHRIVPSPFWRIWYRLAEMSVYRRVDRVLSLSPSYADYAVSLGAKRDKVKILLSPVDMDMFQCHYMSTMSQKWVVYTGGLYNFGALVELVKRFKEVTKQVPDACLIIAGEGEAYKDVKQAVDSEKDTALIKPVALERLADFINSAVVCVNPFQVNKTTKALHSAKILQYLACRKPVVATALEGITRVIPENSGVLYAKSMDDMLSKIVALLKSPVWADSLGEAGVWYVRQNHERSVIVDQLENHLKELVHDKG